MSRRKTQNGRILIVDGYNVIGVRKPIRESIVLEEARRNLTEQLHDYAGWTGQRVILVYDAWLSDRTCRSVEKKGMLEVVFTMKGETADRYIERLCDELEEDIAMRRAEVRVATSDSVEQTVAFGRGAIRMSSRELLVEMEDTRSRRGSKVSTAGSRKTMLGDTLSPEIRAKLEEIRKRSV